MFCPNCHDEFREGFTRCADCEVDLVASLDDAQAVAAAVATAPAAAAAAAPASSSAAGDAPPELIRMVDYCGFLSLDDAKEARGTLREAGIRCEIVIREAPGSRHPQPLEEEFWMRVEHSGYRQASALLGFDESQESDEGDDDPFRL